MNIYLEYGTQGVWGKLVTCIPFIHSSPRHFPPMLVCIPIIRLQPLLLCLVGKPIGIGHRCKSAIGTTVCCLLTVCDLSFLLFELFKDNNLIGDFIFSFGNSQPEITNYYDQHYFLPGRVFV